LARSPISEQDIMQIHAALLSGQDGLNAGRYRTTAVAINNSVAVPPAPQEIAPLMAELSRALHHSEEWPDAVAHATAMHYQLVCIHPFLDGNGRTARLTMNLLLMRAGYSPIFFDLRNRKPYIESLEFAHATSDTSAFEAFIRRELRVSRMGYSCYDGANELSSMRSGDDEVGTMTDGFADTITVVGEQPPPQIRQWENRFLEEERSRRDGGAPRPSGDRPTGRQAVADRRRDAQTEARTERLHQDTIRTVINIQEPSDPGSRVLLNAFVEKLQAIQEVTGNEAPLILVFKGASSRELTEAGYGLLDIDEAFKQLEQSVREGMLEGIARILDADIHNTNELTQSARVYYRCVQRLLRSE
jgi:fido (protein-threonine AMPylation protein)